LRDGWARAARSTSPRRRRMSPISRSTPLLRSSLAPRELHGRRKDQLLADAEQLVGPSSTVGGILGATTVPPPRPSQVHSLQHRCLHKLRCRAGAYSCQRSGDGDSRRWQALPMRRPCPSSPRSSTSGHRPLNPNSRGSTTTPSHCAKGGGCCWTPSSFAARDSSPPCCILSPFVDA
jgi:hypothetical protein